MSSKKCELCDDTMHENPCDCICHMDKYNEKPVTQWNMPNPDLNDILDESSDE